MDNQTLINILDNMNQGKACDVIFTRRIFDHVHVAKSWYNIDTNSRASNITASDFFLIQQNNVFVACIEDRGPKDLHWLVHPDHRGKGYLTIALKDYILPYLFYWLDREEQHISFNSDKSKAVATRCGFNEIQGSIMSITKNEVVPLPEDFEPIDDINPYDHDRVKELQTKLFKAYYDIRMIRDEIDIRYSDVKSFDDALKYQNMLFAQLEDLIFEYNKKMQKS